MSSTQPHPAAATGTVVDPTSDDPFLWLEDVEGERALDWVRERNSKALERLATPREREIERAALEVLDDDAKIPYVSLAGGLLYNFWRDAAHPRGIWRRTTPESYRTASPEWEVLLDLDALNETEGEDWVWHGASVLRPTCDRALVTLSHGGSDADVTRELDLTTLAFVPETDGGFVRPEAKGGVGWIDRDTTFVYTDLGPGTTTPSGYPRTVRRWRRGTPLAEAELVYEGAADDLYISAYHDRTPGFERDLVSRAVTFYESETYVLEEDGTTTLVPVPRSADVDVHREWVVVRLRDAWETAGATYPAGALVAVRLDDLLAGDATPTVLFEPTERASLDSATWTRECLVLTILEDVRNRVEVLVPPADGATGWERGPLPGAPTTATLSVGAVDRDESDDLWVVGTDFLTPATLHVVDAAGRTAPEVLRSAPSAFDASGLAFEQRFATSDDGTRVPYFVVRSKDAAAGEPAPTLLYGYGGFEVSLTADYSGVLGRSWLERGGTYVLANIRGGGEYGPAWHQAALRENRHRAFEDFAAVARDLVTTGVTTPERLGCKGGSNGGLLTGAMLTMYPELFGAIVIQVPLLDMRRYTKLLAGASWAAEYGDPDNPEQWDYLRTFSPYHLVRHGATYPPVLLTTSTRDDRVHPGHARKMTALLEQVGADVTYVENIEGGHGGAADNAQAAHMSALAYEFLWQQLG